MVTKYEATAMKDGDWWLIEVPEVGAYGQAVNLAKAPEVAHEITALWLDVDPAEIEVTVTAKPDPATEAAMAKADAIAAQAAALNSEAARVRAEAVRHYVTEQKVTRREAAAALGISAGRVQQLTGS
ncbi:hypothetical protein ACTXO9_19115 [Brachybacterium tyrofermentans]|uniref:hypothetical protein n=1 Tax=Brachybacterium tyrofermentans TaxID=47848 RepID=UPI003FD1554E